MYDLYIIMGIKLDFSHYNCKAHAAGLLAQAFTSESSEIKSVMV